MKRRRILLACTMGVDREGLRWAVQLARHEEALLVLVALIVVPDLQKRPVVRYEMHHEARDFLEITRIEASQLEVEIERYEVETDDVVQSINGLATRLNCEKMLLFFRESKPLFLRPVEVAALLEEISVPYSIVRLPARKESLPGQWWRECFLPWLFRYCNLERV
jgi:hypothetical protein